MSGSTLGSSAQIPADTTVQGNLQVNGQGVSKVQGGLNVGLPGGVTDVLTVNGNAVVTGNITNFGSGTSTFSNLNVVSKLSVGLGAPDVPGLNVSGLGIRTTGSVTANTFNNNSGTGLVTIIPLIISGSAQPNVTGPLSVGQPGGLVTLLTVNLTPSIPDLLNFKSVYFRISSLATDPGGGAVIADYNGSGSVVGGLFFTGGASPNPAPGSALFDPAVINVSGSADINLPLIGGTVPTLLLRSGQTSTSLGIAFAGAAIANSLNLNTSVTNMYLYVYPIL